LEKRQITSKLKPAYLRKLLQNTCRCIDSFDFKSNTHKAYNRVRESNFFVRNPHRFNLYKKTVGVIGTGKIALLLPNNAGIHCNVIAYDAFESEKLIQSHLCKFEELIKIDVISSTTSSTENQTSF
jgi:lactate dehydrogenase-like 2-hydroxyacid dehydrogenase